MRYKSPCHVSDHLDHPVHDLFFRHGPNFLIWLNHKLKLSAIIGDSKEVQVEGKESLTLCQEPSRIEVSS
jgi:hypothetical protein